MNNSEGERDETRLLSSLDKYDGKRAGNITLKNELGWSEARYWEIRNRLVDKGLLGLGRGKGGSVFRVDATSDIFVPAVIADFGISETDLYEPVARVLKESWVKDFRFMHWHVEITAKQGRRETGGKWSRPDITVVGVSSYQFLPSKYLDVVTFEVKRFEATDVAAVYEALAHRRAATRSYVLIHSDNEATSDDPIIEELCDEAGRHGIGVFVVTNPADYRTWDERVIAERTDPNPEKLNEFITLQLPDSAKAELSRALR